MTERGNTSAQSKGRSDRGTPRQGQRHWFVESLPRNILADTGPIFALIHAGDADHGRAVQFARGFAGRLITTWPVLTEVSYLLDQSDRRGVAVLFDMILDGHLSVAEIDSADVRYMRALREKYKTMDLADASLVAIGERLGVLDVITIDRRDFLRYRTRASRAFVNHFPEAG